MKRKVEKNQDELRKVFLTFVIEFVGFYAENIELWILELDVELV